MSVHLQSELEKLKMKLLLLGGATEALLEKASYALKNLDVKVAEEVIQEDHKIDAAEVEVEEDCLKILALHTPVANDLRFVVATLKINNDLERVCDLGVNIGERVKFLAAQNAVTPPFDIELMTSKCLAMINLALDSFIHLDGKLAKQVTQMDDEVDDIHRGVYKTVFSGIRAKPEQLEPLIHYLTISKHLERVADYATNIAEDVIYMVEGEIVRHSR